MSGRYETLNRQKSMSSHAASISAWNTVLLWFSIVAAFKIGRYRPASSSAAFRKMAARDSQDIPLHPGRAAAAAAIA